MTMINRRSVNIETGAILKIIGILLALAFLYFIRDVLFLVFAALFLAALLHPAARFLRRIGIPKGVTVISLYLALFGMAALAISLLLPLLIEQSSHLLGSLGQSWETLSNSVQSVKEFSRTYGLTTNLQAGVQSLEEQIGKAASGLFFTLTSIFGGLVGLIVVLVMAYYMVVQEEGARQLFYQFVPEAYQEITSTILRRVEEKIGRWLIGQLSLAVLIGMMYYIGLSVIGVNSALILSLFGGFMEFIPYLGPILSAIPVLILAVTQSPVTALFALALLIVIQQFENHIIIPKVMQRAVGINPLVSIIALLIGAKLFGLLGVLFAIPVATTLSVILTELYHYIKVSQSHA